MIDERSRLLRRLLKELKMKESSDKYKVYGFIDPISNTLFYIGCTKIHIAERIRQHFNELSINSKKQALLFDLLRLKTLPKVHIFYESYDKLEARTVEANLIMFLSDVLLSIEILNVKKVINKII